MAFLFNEIFSFVVNANNYVVKNNNKGGATAKISLGNFILLSTPQGATPASPTASIIFYSYAYCTSCLMYLPDEQKKKLCASLATLRFRSQYSLFAQVVKHEFGSSLVALRSPKCSAVGCLSLALRQIRDV